MITLDELIARAEGETGQDRLLDGQIMFALFARPVGDRGYIWPADDPGWVFAMRFSQSMREARSKLEGETIEWQLPGGDWILMNNLRVPKLTVSLDAALKVFRDALPGFWWRGGTCAVSSEAIVCPDHNCPAHGERLRTECPPTIAHWNEGIEVELRPGNDAALVRSLLAATMRAWQLKGGTA